MTDSGSATPTERRTEVEVARAEVLAARAGLENETVRLGAAARSAVDIPSKVRQDPVKTAGIAAGVVFLGARGPQRLFRRVKRLIWGPEADMPKSMLPDEVEKTLRKLGSDGEKVRGTLEREFANYLDEKSEARKERDLGAVAATVLGNVLKPASSQAGKRLASALFSPNQKGFEEALRRFGARRSPSASPEPPPAPAASPKDRPRRP